jgi:hypothetical protein
VGVAELEPGTESDELSWGAGEADDEGDEQ